MSPHTLKQKGPIDARTLSGVGFRDWGAVGSGVCTHCSKERKKLVPLALYKPLGSKNHDAKSMQFDWFTRVPKFIPPSITILLSAED